MNRDCLARSGESPAEQVIVGRCSGLYLLRPDELAAYNKGQLLVLAAALTAGLVEFLVWLAF